MIMGNGANSRKLLKHMAANSKPLRSYFALHLNDCNTLSAKSAFRVVSYLIVRSDDAVLHVSTTFRSDEVFTLLL